MHRGAYDFVLKRDKSLAEEAERAVDRIYTAGLMFRNGRVGPGGNNVMAASAAKAFTDKDLVELHRCGEPRPALCAEIIAMRKHFDSLAADNSGKGQEILEKIYEKAQDLKAKGWTPSSEPHRVNQFAAPRP